ncbi:protein YIF1B-A [Ricinus communis]|uniref:protein YIF1B-A n=1 Tax=Ricinus communis TaxID=3988 RepID=UPI00201AC1CA|nr:protein YIF1B-A [Ricinus communis]
MIMVAAMYGNKGSHAQVFMSPSSSLKEADSFGEAAIIYQAGSDIIRSELGAFGEKLLGPSTAYVQSNFIRKYLSNPQYYFQVNDEYVKNKLKIILFPFLHRGYWVRSIEKVGGQVSYKPPIYDINAPDLYIPFMAFGTYLVLAGILLGINGKFSPEALSVQSTNGLLCWFFQVLLLEATLHTLGDGDVPLLDFVAYTGYTFAAGSAAVLARMACRHCFYTVTLWESFCMGMFFVKVMKRILISEMRSCEKHSSKRHYLLLLVAIAQAPLLFWLGNVGV